MVTSMERNFNIQNMLSTGEVARVFGVHPTTVRRWAEKGILKAYRIGPGGSRRYSRENVAALYFERAIKNFIRD